MCYDGFVSGPNVGLFMQHAARLGGNEYQFIRLLPIYMKEYSILNKCDKLDGLLAPP